VVRRRTGASLTPAYEDRKTKRGEGHRHHAGARRGSSVLRIRRFGAAASAHVTTTFVRTAAEEVGLCLACRAGCRVGCR